MKFLVYNIKNNINEKANSQGISGVCCGIKKSYKNYEWKYLEGLN